MRRVLVVEDDQLVLDAIKAAFLQRGGFELDCAGDGEAGLSALSVANLDLALIDYGLPKVPGITLAKYALSRSIPVVLMTGYFDLTAESDGHQFPTLGKPFSVTQLVEKFEQVVAEAKRLNETMQRHIEESQAGCRRLRVEWLALCEQMRTRR